MPRFLKAPQGSKEWAEGRCGHATASRFADIMEGKGARESYLYELVAERLGGPMRDSGGMAKDWGHNSEPLARAEYTIRTGHLVQEVGFALHDRIMWLGASSDGLVDDDGCIEVKSPFNSSIHIRTFAKGMPQAHFWQTAGNLWLLKRKWIDFLSFDVSFNAPLNLYIERQLRNEKAIKDLEFEVKRFLSEVNVAVNDIKASSQNAKV